MKITQGLDIPIAGKPEQKIYDHPQPTTLAILGRDFHELKPALQVKEGDLVKAGQVLFSHRKHAGINFTAPCAGIVKAINRGEKRALVSVVLQVASEEECIDFGAHEPASLSSLDEATIREKLQASGQWIAFRTRPYSYIPDTQAKAAAIFVTAMDTRPLAADPKVVIAEQSEAFQHGLIVLARLAPKVYVCHEQGYSPPKVQDPHIVYASFAGVHPAGLPGTHIHFLEPVSEKRSVWHLNYQDVIAIGKLFTTGKLFVERIIALAGPAVKKPRLIRTRLGANTDGIVSGELIAGPYRVISGSVLAGQTATQESAYLGRYDLQVSAISEEQPRVFLHWLRPWLSEYSMLPVFLKPGLNKQEFAMTSTQNGSHRAMVPLGNYEAVMPLDILATQLLRSLLIRDTVMAQQLGALELDEEDLALCTFVCHSKYEYGPALRDCLHMLERGE
ncbi:MAG TPA: Na(+)-translocating NADH-quinone reductase subunit A [Thiolinea sp.]|nr:Na(+)-translocating NADH-quinone reductase subunit A [Thiolinea sp.]